VTERWRKRLEGIDQVGPSDDVYQRAKSGPSLPEPQSPMQRTSTRVVTAIAAFVVFALAISVFAIPALRLGNKESFVPGGDQLQPLWPWNSIDAVQAWRDDPQPIGSTSVDHFSSPDDVAAAFGRDVIGWTEVYPHEEGMPDVYACPATVPPGSIAIPAPVTDATARCVAYLGSVAPTPAPYAPTTAAPAFRTFDLSTCPPNAACDYAAPGPPSIKVVVYQPLGDEGPWAVLEAKTDYVSISLDPGTQLRDGSTAYAGGSIPTGEHAVLGYHAPADGCGEHSDTTAFELGTDAASDRTSGGLSFAYSRGQLQFTLPPQGDACRAQVGYVFVAITDQGLATTDPLGGIPVTTGVLGFAAVPVSIVFLSQGASATTVSTTTDPAGYLWTTYTDRLGWTIDVPADWVSQRIEDDLGKVSYSGAAFGSSAPEVDNGPSATPTLGPAALGAAPGEVMVALYELDGGPGPSFTDDSTLPLTFDGMVPFDGGSEQAFQADGLRFYLTIRIGSDAMSPEQLSIVKRMVSSVAFTPWHAGEERNGYTALDPTIGRPAEWKRAGLDWERLGGHSYVYLENGQAGVLLGPMPECAGEIQGAAANVRAPLLDCADGTNGGWTMNGLPLQNNSPTLMDPVDVHPVFHVWDGTLVTALGTTIGY
jgi:hypothetical protein